MTRKTYFGPSTARQQSRFYEIAGHMIQTPQASKMAYIVKEINKLMGRAIHRYGLLEDGDRIMVAVSGGADSLVMLHFLDKWTQKAPISFHIFPVYLDMGFGNKDTWHTLQIHFSRLKLPWHMEETDFGPYAHGKQNRGKSPCFICSLNRRKRLFELTRALGCNKIAMGHNLDDLIETFFINMCYSGEMSTMLPRQEMFKGLITIIRPLALIEKGKIERATDILKLPVCKNRCPSVTTSRRQEIRDLLTQLYSTNKKIRSNLQKALFHIRPEYLPG